MFKIIGLEILNPNERCLVSEKQTNNLPLDKKMELELPAAIYQSVHKGLAPGNKYMFYHNYHINNGAVSKTNNDITDKLFGDKVSICAIVGENGSGKSTLLEMVFRLMNNVAFALRKGFWPDDNIKVNNALYLQHYIPCIFARMYIENDEGFYIIEQRDLELSIKSTSNNNCTNYNWSYLHTGYNFIMNAKHEEQQKRLSSLFYSIVVNYASYAFNINDYLPEWSYETGIIDENDQSVDGILFQNQWSSEKRSWIGTLFHKNDGYQLPIVLNPFREGGNINYNNERSLLNERLVSLVRNVDIDTLEYILQGKRPHCFVFDINQDFSEAQYEFYNSNRVVGMFDNAIGLPNDFNEAKNNIKRYSENIINAWNTEMKIDLRKQNFTDKGDFRRALNYLVYKTVKITLKYDDFKKYRRSWEDEKLLCEYISKLITTDNHITAKIRKTLALILFAHYHSSLGHNDKTHIVDIEQFKDLTDKYNGIEKGNIKWKGEDLMPAPCFNTDLWFKLHDGKLIKYAQFSSGEKQMINLVCTIIYHLNNIHGNIKSNKNINYPYVNIMIDEIELYFHPRYQTMLTKFLLTAIEKMNFDEFKGINIILSTHSPYILSDVPKNNILKLKEGDVCTEETPETFGANVYNLLYHHFFMDKFIGDYASDVINELIKDVIKAKKISLEEKKSLRDKLVLIGDDYIRNSLIAKLDSYDKD